ncbi:unnamed protein product [Mytilus coruscus]|uniref:Uncharacterized protein n=1 Tax=Mytilus coruscus TaxID=42192 RepID=A0A6J8BL18_MYTCO|nr:unnamed protein product [Mytilus coruscus]
MQTTRALHQYVPVDNLPEQRQQTSFEISDRVNIRSPSPVPVAQLIEETDVWNYLSCMGVDRHMIHSLLINCMYTDDWSLDKLKQNVWQEYLFWHCVIAVVEDSVELSFKENMPIIFENLNYSSVNVSVFLRKIRNKMKSVFKKKDLSIGKEQAIGIAFKDVGPICEKEGIRLDWLKNPSPIPNKIDVTNGLIVELRKVRMQHSILHKTVALWVQFLCHLNYTPDSDGLKRNIELVYKKLSKISLHNRQNVSAYLTEQYIPPQKRNTLCNSDLTQMKKGIVQKSITERNSLITPVYYYVDNPVYLAGCRAFGIVDKILTGPIWRIIESTSHILDLNKVWFDFKKILEKYSVDATELVEGKVLYPEYTVQDKVFESLFLIDNEELNILTTEALQIVLLNFCIIIERQLFDNLPGGSLNEETEGVNGKELRDESMTVKPTNIVSERDFANLDRLKREKPNANIIALEGLILFTNNKTLHWLDQMETEKKTQTFKIARERAPAMLKQFKLRKEHI